MGLRRMAATKRERLNGQILWINYSEYVIITRAETPYPISSAGISYRKQQLSYSHNGLDCST
jgi:hypothetical protein